MMIGLLISDLLNETLLAWARAAAERAEELGYQTILCDGRTSPDVEARQLEQLVASRVDAICLVGPVNVPAEIRDRVAASGIVLSPDFMHDRARSLHERSIAERDAIDAAVDVLAASGCRWLATVAAPLDDFAEDVFDGRRRAIEARATERRVALDPTRDHLGPDPDTLRRLIVRRRTAGGVFVLNHDLAGSAIATVLAAGRAIPDDVSVVAFGDSRAARLSVPRTTVISRDMTEEGRRHIEVLIGQLATAGVARASDGPPLAMETAALIERDTTGRGPRRRR